LSWETDDDFFAQPSVVVSEVKCGRTCKCENNWINPGGAGAKEFQRIFLPRSSYGLKGCARIVLDEEG
jgi:hypothetical protein